nr:FAR1 DNA binding domain, zinc finger, SWIM-type, MULE transposase domain, FHY3/FAR1 family [Tanacetum cinerariifolium]
MSLSFADTHNMVAYLNKSDASEGFTQIIDFLNGNYIMLQALVDRKKLVITEASIRDVLRLDDADGVDCLHNEEIFAKLARMGYEKPSTMLTFYKAFFSSQWKFLIHTILQPMSAKHTSWNEFSSALSSAVICLSTGRKFNFSKYIFESLVRNVDSSSKFYMYPRFIQLIIQNQLSDLSTHTTRYTSPALTKKVFANMKRVGKGLSGVKMPLFEGMLVVGENVDEGIAKERVQDDAVVVAAQEGVTAAIAEDVQEQSVPSPTLPPQPQDLPSTSQRIDTSDDTVIEDVSNKRKMIHELDKDEGVALLLKKRKKRKLKRLRILLEDEPAEVEEAVDVVTTVKLITEVVAAVSESVTAAITTIVAVSTATITVVPVIVASASTRRRKGVVISFNQTYSLQEFCHLPTRFTHEFQFMGEDDFKIVKVRDHVGFYVVSKDGTRTWYPHILPHGKKPIQGTQSVSIDQAYSFYVAYGKKAGFNVRRGGEYKAVGFGDATTKYFHCTKEGFLPNPKEKSGVRSLDVDISEHSEVSDGFERFRNPKKKQSRRKPTFRCGCLASLTIKKIEMCLRNIGYTKHHFLYQVSNANFGPAIGFRLMKQIYGGLDMVGVTVNDCKNQKKKISVLIGDDDRLVGLFWADEEAIRNYATFGDIVSFDATFRSNKYQMVFFPFTEINHHNRCIIFASGLLADETAGAYIWHRLCMWHIMMKLGTKVEFCKSEMKLHCGCNRYEVYGLLCRHTFYVLRMNNVKESPKSCLHKRWLKNAKPSSFDRRRITGTSDVVQSEVLELCKIFESSIDRLVHDLDKLHIYKDKMKELLNQAEIDVPMVPKVNSKAVMSAMLGVDEPEKVLIGNPNLSKVKGTGCFSRMKHVAEVTVEELAKRRTYGLCGGKEGHNKRTCTNEPASKKPKVQAALKEKAAPKQQASQPRRSRLRSSTPK